MPCFMGVRKSEGHAIFIVSILSRPRIGTRHAIAMNAYHTVTRHEMRTELDLYQSSLPALYIDDVGMVSDEKTRKVGADLVFPCELNTIGKPIDQGRSFA